MISNTLNPHRHKTSQSCRSFITILGLLFIFNPLASLFCGGIWLVSSKKTDQINLRFWLALLALWISMVNITKVPASDQIMYQHLYAKCGHLNLWDGLFNYTHTKFKEPGYGLYQYICYHIFWGNDKLFFLTSSFVSYWLLFLSTSIILLRAGQGVKAVMFGVVCCAFFNQFFYLSIHLLRQIMAFSIVLYAIALHTQDGRNHWIWLICAPLIHTTAALFSILAIFPFIYHRMNLKETLILLCPLLLVSVGSIAFGELMLSIVGENSASSYAFRRLSTDYDDGVDSNPLVVAIMIAPLAIISILNLYRLSKHQRETFNSSLYPIIYIFLFLAIFILSMSSRPLMQYRFVFVTYQILPLLLPLLLPTKSRWRDPYFLIVGAFFILRFFLTLSNSSWTYQITMTDMLTWPVPLYFLAS